MACYKGCCSTGTGCSVSYNPLSSANYTGNGSASYHLTTKYEGGSSALSFDNYNSLKGDNYGGGVLSQTDYNITTTDANAIVPAVAKDNLDLDQKVEKHLPVPQEAIKEIDNTIKYETKKETQLVEQGQIPEQKALVPQQTMVIPKEKVQVLPNKRSARMVQQVEIEQEIRLKRKIKKTIIKN